MNKIPFYSETKKALDKAKDALENAKYNFAGNFYLATANRAYYVCYYSMSALLYYKNIFAKSHQGARTKFLEIFIKSNIFSTELSKTISLLFDFRQQSDYDLDADITLEEAKNIIALAEEFYIICENYYSQVLNND